MITHISKQFCRRFVQIGFFILTSYCLVSRAQSASYAIINLDSCPICEVQYSYDFSIVVGLAVDNLERISNRTNSILSGDPGTVTPDTGSVIIEEVSIQVCVYVTELMHVDLSCMCLNLFLCILAKCKKEKKTLACNNRICETLVITIT